MKKGNFNINNFSGTVYLKDGFWYHDGIHKTAVAGYISILEASTITGFDPGKSESNWVARVTDKDSKQSMNILGCQIRSIFQGNIEEVLAVNTLDMRKVL